MSKRSKRYLESRNVVDFEKKYELKEKILIVKISQKINIGCHAGIDINRNLLCWGFTN